MTSRSFHLITFSQNKKGEKIAPSSCRPHVINFTSTNGSRYLSRQQGQLFEIQVSPFPHVITHIFFSLRPTPHDARALPKCALPKCALPKCALAKCTHPKCPLLNDWRSKLEADDMLEMINRSSIFQNHGVFKCLCVCVCVCVRSYVCYVRKVYWCF